MRHKLMEGDRCKCLAEGQHHNLVGVVDSVHYQADNVRVRFGLSKKYDEFGIYARKELEWMPHEPNPGE